MKCSCKNDACFADDKISSSGVVLIKETGKTAQIEKLETLSWEDRVEVNNLCKHLIEIIKPLTIIYDCLFSFFLI